jgi:hypothetical protein
MIRMPGTNGQGSVDLFGGDDRSQFMGQSNSSKGNGKAGTTEGFGSPAVGRTYGHDHLLDTTILNTPKCGGKLFGGHLFPPAVGQDEVGSRAPGWTIEMGEQGSLSGKLTLLTGNISAGALDVALEQLGVRFRGGRAPWPDGCEEDFHCRSTELHRRLQIKDGKQYFFTQNQKLEGANINIWRMA